MFIICFLPNLLGHPDNYIPANPLVTPAHIVPEWYFLLFYAILRTIPSKLGGVLFLVCAIFILIIIPYIHSVISYKYLKHLKIYHFIFWLFVINCILLAWTGGNPAESPFIELARLCVFFYFAFFIIFFPFFPLYFYISFFSKNFESKQLSILIYNNNKYNNNTFFVNK